MSVHNWGEDPVGYWTLELVDTWGYTGMSQYSEPSLNAHVQLLTFSFCKLGNLMNSNGVSRAFLDTGLFCLGISSMFACMQKNTDVVCKRWAALSLLLVVSYAQL